MDPLLKFNDWLSEASDAGLRVPHATTLSTIGLDGFPNARSVAIKGVTDGAVEITGPTSSRKGLEISADPRVALTCWWEPLGRQVRLQGTAAPLPEERAREIFDARPRDARLIARVSRQGEPRVGEDLEVAYAAADSQPGEPSKPTGWGGWSITPHRVEFMEFSDSRFHDRELYEHDGSAWSVTRLQP